jgi:hypothetical protein
VSLKGYVKKGKPALWVTMRKGKVVAEVRPSKPLRRSRVRPRSKRMAKLMAYYKSLKAQFLLDHPLCAVHRRDVGNVHHADQIHHSRGRVGTLLLDIRFYKGVCAAGHDLIGEHPDLARGAGLLCVKGDWNKAPDDAETRRLRELMRELTK